VASDRQGSIHEGAHQFLLVVVGEPLKAVHVREEGGVVHRHLFALLDIYVSLIRWEVKRKLHYDHQTTPHVTNSHMAQSFNV
jgi:hypothetical protein